MLARLYILTNINEERVSEISNRLERELGYDVNMKKASDKPSAVVKYRTNAPGLQFTVGMVMRDLKFNHICVIYDWDEKFIKSSNEWFGQVIIESKTFLKELLL